MTYVLIGYDAACRDFPLFSSIFLVFPLFFPHCVYSPKERISGVGPIFGLAFQGVIFNNSIPPLRTMMFILMGGSVVGWGGWGGVGVFYSAVPKVPMGFAKGPWET